MQRAAHIVVVVAQGLSDRLAYGLEPGKMNYGAEIETLENIAQGCRIADISFDDDGLFAADCRDPSNYRARTIGKIIKYHRLVAGLQKLDDGMRTDVAGTASDQDRHRALPDVA